MYQSVNIYSLLILLDCRSSVASGVLVVFIFLHYGYSVKASVGERVRNLIFTAWSLIQQQEAIDQTITCTLKGVAHSVIIVWSYVRNTCLAKLKLAKLDVNGYCQVKLWRAGLGIRWVDSCDYTSVKTALLVFFLCLPFLSSSHFFLYCVSPKRHLKIYHSFKLTFPGSFPQNAWAFTSFA